MSGRHQWTLGRKLNGLISLLIMAAIFYFSSGNGKDSSNMSRQVTEWLIPFVYPGYSSLGAAQQAGAFSMLHWLVRKAAHFGEFALLAAAFRQFLWTFPLKWPGILSFVLTAAYAGLDEWHQLYVDGRSGQVSDIAVDCAGALCGVFLAAAVTAMLLLAGKKRLTNGT